MSLLVPKLLLLTALMAVQPHADAFVPAAKKPSSSRFGMFSSEVRSTQLRKGGFLPSARQAGSSLELSMSASPAVCFCGGGFLSLTTQAAIVTALMKNSGKNLDELFSRIETIGSNSGGTWFAAELIYSKSFKDLLEAMARKTSPEEMGDLFNSDWSLKFKPDGISQESFELAWQLNAVLKQAMEDKGIGGDLLGALVALGDFYGTLTAFLDGFRDGKGEELFWLDFVEQLLKSTGGIGMDVKLGDPVNTWCESGTKPKTWIVNTSTLAPTEERPVLVSTPAKSLLTVTGLLIPKGAELEYHVNADIEASGQKNNNFQVPTRFSVQLGTQDSHFENVCDGAFKNVQATYKSVDESKPGSEGGFGIPSDNVASLPVVGVAACSSAVIGNFVSTSRFVQDFSDGFGKSGKMFDDISSAKLLRKAFEMFEVYPDVLVAPKLGGKDAFLEPKALRKTLRDSKRKADLSPIADMNLCTVNDGGSTDNSGILHAVGAGATEVYAFLNFEDNFLALCYDDENSFLPFSPWTPYPIFDLKRSEARTAMDETFKKLIPQNEDSSVRRVRVGTFDVRTTPQAFAGVKGGTQVKVHIVLVDSKITKVGIGRVWDMEVYGDYLRDLTKVLLENDQQVLSDIVSNLEGTPVSLN